MGYMHAGWQKLVCDMHHVADVLCRSKQQAIRWQSQLRQMACPCMEQLLLAMASWWQPFMVACISATYMRAPDIFHVVVFLG